VLSTRGAVVGSGAACAAVAGLAYGVEEFVLLAIAVGVLLAVGVVTVWRRRGVSRRALRVVVRVPVAEVTARQSAVVELTVTNTGRRRGPPVAVEDPAGKWSVSHPGLGESSVAGTSRASRARGVSRGDTSSGRDRPAPGWLDGDRSRPGRRQRARDRRTVSRTRRLPGLRPGTDTTLTIPVPTGSRGLLTLADVGLWCEDPFRLWARRATVAPPAHVIVYPTPAEVSEDGRTTGAHPGNRAPRSTAGSTGALSGDELSGLRPYAPGDRLTRLHWPSLARTGELVVREFLEPQAGSLSLLVDLRPSAHTAASVEETISRAAGLGARALRQGLTVELCTSTGDRMVIPPNAAGRQTMLRALALLGPASAPAAVVRRWGDRPTGGAVWATASGQSADVVLVTTATGAAQRTLPESLRRQVETVLVP